ncbi:MAG: hypothetical protein AB1500_00925 [Bacillota bacterium]
MGESCKSDEDIRVVYQVYTEDIRHAKNQQWLTTYYVLSLQAAIAGFDKLLVKNDEFQVEMIIAAFIALAIASISTKVLMEYQYSLVKYRCYIDNKIKPLLSEAAQCAVDKAPAYSIIEAICRDFNKGFLCIFVAILWIGTAFVLWIIFNPLFKMLPSKYDNSFTEFLIFAIINLVCLFIAFAIYTRNLNAIKSIAEKEYNQEKCHTEMK